jgi:hypothetical protein
MTRRRRCVIGEKRVIVELLPAMNRAPDRQRLGVRFRFTVWSFGLPFQFSDYAAGAVAINRHNFDLLCDDDCGAWDQLAMTHPS